MSIHEDDCGSYQILASFSIVESCCQEVASWSRTTFLNLIILLFLFYFFLFLNFIYLFIYGCVGSSFLCEGFLQLRQAGATLHHGAWASHYRGLSRCGAQAPDAQAQ